MDKQLIADLIMAAHFGWILFMLYGLALTVRGFWRPAFWDRWMFRTVHLLGIMFVASLGIVGKYCPLTVWEYGLRRAVDPSGDAPRSFFQYYLQKIIYPDISIEVISGVTIAAALFTIVMYVLKPPGRVKRVLGRLPV